MWEGSGLTRMGVGAGQGAGAFKLRLPGATRSVHAAKGALRAANGSGAATEAAFSA